MVLQKGGGASTASENPQIEKESVAMQCLKQASEGKLHVVIALSDCMFLKNERTNVASYLKVGGSGGSHG